MNILIKDIPPEHAAYFDTCARLRDITVTRLFQKLFDLIGQDQLVLSILDDDSQPVREKHEHHYRKTYGAKDYPI